MARIKIRPTGEWLRIYGNTEEEVREEFSRLKRENPGKTSWHEIEEIRLDLQFRTMSEGRVVKVTNGGKSTVGTVASIYETTRFVGVGLPNEPVWFIKIRVRLSEKDEVLGVSERYVSNYYAKGEWEYLD